MTLLTLLLAIVSNFSTLRVTFPLTCGQSQCASGSGVKIHMQSWVGARFSDGAFGGLLRNGAFRGWGLWTSDCSLAAACTKIEGEIAYCVPPLRMYNKRTSYG